MSAEEYVAYRHLPLAAEKCDIYKHKQENKK